MKWVKKGRYLFMDTNGVVDNILKMEWLIVYRWLMIYSGYNI